MAMIEITNLQNKSGLELYDLMMQIKKSDAEYLVKKAKIEVVLIEVNERGRKLAKKHGKPYHHITAGKVLR